MELDFDKIYKIPTVALNISRCHPYIKRDKKWLLQFTIMHGVYTLFFLLLVYNIIYYNLKINDFSQTCKNGVIIDAYFVITFQYFVLIWHRDSVLEMIKDIKKDYELSKNLTMEEQNIIFEYVNMSKMVCKQWLVVPIMGCGFFLVKNVGLMLYYFINNDFQLIEFYELTYPPIIEQNKDKFYVYLLIYLFVFISDAYTGIGYAAFVPLGPIFMLHACAQLDLVKKKIDNLFVDCDEQVIREKLNDIVKHMQYIYSFVDRINEIFQIGYELTLKASSIMLPITCYEVIAALNKSEFPLEFITFILGAILISSSPCYYSDLLMEKGENVRLSLYSCGWEMNYDRRTRTTLQLMLQRALRPMAIRTVFRSLCLDALTDVFQQSYAIFSLINAMWD